MSRNWLAFDLPSPSGITCRALRDRKIPISEAAGNEINSDVLFARPSIQALRSYW
jgi:hypothetical protein